VSAGCQNCYARSIYQRFGKDFGQVTTHFDKVERLYTAKFPEYSPKRGAPHKPMAFICDTGDLFHEAVPDTFIDDAMCLMCTRNDVIWQVLTKRAERMADYLYHWCNEKARGPVPDNVWLGVTAENQQTIDVRVPLLLGLDAAVRFVSVEPMLGPVWWVWRNRVNWVVCGAESGPSRRPFEVAWAVDLYKQCENSHVAFFGKQDSALRPGSPLLLPGLVHEWPR
jgi:protein gp37